MLVIFRKALPAGAWLMMNRFFAILIAAFLALSCTAAFADAHTHDDGIRFEYDDARFGIAMDDHTDAEDLIIPNGKDEAWGGTSSASTRPT